MSMAMDMNNNNNNMMHASFYWGRNAIIVFPSWPENSIGMYILALLLVSLASAAVELLSIHAAVNEEPNTLPIIAAYSRACVYALRVALSYVVMLSVMSFNVGVFVAAIVGHTVGFFAVRVRTVRRSKLDPNEEEISTPSLVM